jgi:streptogramin lyase
MKAAVRTCGAALLAAALAGCFGASLRKTIEQIVARPSGTNGSGSSTHVYVAGCVGASSNSKVPVYWEDGVLNYLPLDASFTNGWADQVATDSSGVLYITGGKWNSTTTVHGYWKGGTFVTVSLGPYVECWQNGIVVDAAGNVWMAGIVGTSSPPTIQVYWKNGGDPVLIADCTNLWGMAADSSGNVYMTGTVGGTSLNAATVDDSWTPTCWKNGASPTTLAISGGNTNGWAGQMAVDASGNMYACGGEWATGGPSVPFYWQAVNGTWGDPILLPVGSYTGAGYSSWAVSGTSVDDSGSLYFIGRTGPSDTLTTVVYWKGATSSPVLLPLGGNAYWNIWSGAVDPQGNYYISGTVGSSSTSTIPVCWKNGGNYTPLPMGSGNTYGEANSVLVGEGPNPAGYSVSYFGNGATGGAVPTDPNAYQQGQTATVLTNNGNLVKSGCAFSGWNTQPNGGGTALAPGDACPVGAANVALYAQWLPLQWVTLGTGSGAGQFWDPAGIALDSSGRIYIADTANNRVVRIDDPSGVGWTTYGTGGNGSGQFANPRGVAVDASGRIYVGDSDNCRIVRIDDMSGSGWTTYGTWGSGTGQFRGVQRVALDSSSRIYVSDAGANRIVRIDDMSGAGWTVYGSAGSGGGQFSEPGGIAVDASGGIYVADRGNNRIVRVDDMTGKGWTAYGTAGYGTGQFAHPSGIAIGAGGVLLVADKENGRIVRINDMSGAGWTAFGISGSGTGQFSCASGIALDASGRIYIADMYNNRVVRINDMSGAGWAVYGAYGNGMGQFMAVSGVAVDSGGRIYVTDWYNNRIVRINDMSGAGWTAYGSLGNGTGQFWSPSGIVVDSSGRICVADPGNNRIILLTLP